MADAQCTGSGFYIPNNVKPLKLHVFWVSDTEFPSPMLSHTGPDKNHVYSMHFCIGTPVAALSSDVVLSGDDIMKIVKRSQIMPFRT